MASLVKCYFNLWIILIMILQIAFYGISYTSFGTTYLAVTVARVLPPNCWIWTLLTFNFYNVRILHLLFDMVTIYLVDVVMFPSWKMSEVIRCCVLSQLLASGLTVCTLFIGYACTFNIDLLWTTPICGLSPLLGTTLVVARQLTPDNILINLPLGKFRIKHIAFATFTCFLLLAIFHITDYVYFLLISYGIFVTWIYLRFFQRHCNGDIGDTTDVFKFSGFFPNHLEPPISIASNAVYSLLVKLHLCRPQIIYDTECLDSLHSIRVVNNKEADKQGSSLEVLKEEDSIQTQPSADVTSS